jgi:hypothetical protein
MQNNLVTNFNTVLQAVLLSIAGAGAVARVVHIALALPHLVTT